MIPRRVVPAALWAETSAEVLVLGMAGRPGMRAARGRLPHRRPLQRRRPRRQRQPMRLADHRVLADAEASADFRGRMPLVPKLGKVLYEFRRPDGFHERSPPYIVVVSCN